MIDRADQMDVWHFGQAADDVLVFGFAQHRPIDVIDDEEEMGIGRWFERVHNHIHRFVTVAGGRFGFHHFGDEAVQNIFDR